MDDIVQCDDTTVTRRCLSLQFNWQKYISKATKAKTDTFRQL